MLGFLVRAAIVALGLWVSSARVPGVRIDGPSTLFLAGILLGVVNAIVRPIAIILTLPMTVVTLGLFLLVINAGMVGLVAWILPGMHVAGFWAAFWTSVIVSLVSMIGSWFVGPKGRIQVIVRRD
ncbi:MAG: phage holin family protein [Gammaproteobacteria bacterium]|nr:phage holin family protein [Gammaproteobacteria bacterium]MDE2347331.1 phage holin family protein [Gammaproteobacteria bacterium]